MTSTLPQTTKIQIRAGLSGYVAELTAALIGADIGLPTIHLDDHAAYIGSWLAILRQDSRALLTAAARAEEAAGFLLRATNLLPVATDQKAAA